MQDVHVKSTRPCLFVVANTPPTIAPVMHVADDRAPESSAAAVRLVVAREVVLAMKREKRTMAVPCAPSSRKRRVHSLIDV